LSLKTFFQVVILIIIFAVTMSAVKCLHRISCPTCKSIVKKCLMAGDKDTDYKGNRTQ